MPKGRLQGQGERALLRLAASLTLPLLLAAGCKGKPAAGRPCATVGVVACADPGRAFVCDALARGEGGERRASAGGTWTQVVCRGPGGCKPSGGADDCDDTLAAEGDPCPLGPPVDYACTGDGAQALACSGGHFGLWRSCRGPDGCRVVDGRDVTCDTSLGRAGDPCGQPGAYACSVDRAAMLVCRDGALAPASSCSGPAACRVDRETRRVDCDDSLAAEGDPCDQTRRITCSVDHKAELVCEGGRYAKKRECRRTDCRLDGPELYCD